MMQQIAVGMALALDIQCAGAESQTYGPLCNEMDASGIIQKVIDTQPIVHFPTCNGCIQINAAALQFSVDHRPVTLEGEGWSSAGAQPLGGTGWNCTNVKGTVLQITGQSDGIDFSAPNYNQNIVIKNLAILGPGTGQSIGINFGTSSAAYIHLDNVLVANFSTCYLMNNTLSSAFYDIHASGCGTGVSLTGADSDLNFYRVDAEGNGVGFNVGAGSGIRLYGGLLQANQIGLKIAPTAFAATALTFDGLWTEANSVNSILIDTTLQPVTGLTIANSRCSDSGSSVIVLQGGKTIALTHLHDLYCAGASVMLPAYMNHAHIEDVDLAALIDNSSCATLINTPLANKLGNC
jgi:hypothetical protein